MGVRFPSGTPNVQEPYRAFASLTDRPDDVRRTVQLHLTEILELLIVGFDDTREVIDLASRLWDMVGELKSDPN